LPALLPGHEGIDVSRHQGAIDWALVARAGKRFAGIRASVGYLTDDQFKNNWAGAARAGVWRLPYHYFVAELSPQKQAESFCAALGGDAGELPPVLDVEPRKNEPPTDREAFTAAIKKWLDLVEGVLRVRPIVYTNGPAWSQMTTAPTWAAGYRLWVARYALVPPAPAGLPAHFGAPHIWQYTAFGQCSGIVGNVDQNRVLTE
jgi:lysozyme